MEHYGNCIVLILYCAQTLKVIVNLEGSVILSYIFLDFFQNFGFEIRSNV